MEQVKASVVIAKDPAKDILTIEAYVVKCDVEEGNLCIMEYDQGGHLTGQHVFAKGAWLYIKTSEHPSTEEMKTFTVNWHEIRRQEEKMTQARHG